MLLVFVGSWFDAWRPSNFLYCFRIGVVGLAWYARWSNLRRNVLFEVVVLLLLPKIWGKGIDWLLAGGRCGSALRCFFYILVFPKFSNATLPIAIVIDIVITFRTHKYKYV